MSTNTTTNSISSDLNSSADGWLINFPYLIGNHYIYNEDCIQIMKDWKDHNLNCDLIFADPPFNINQKYDKHNDKLSQINYSQFYLAWMEAAIPLLRTDGLLVINTPDDNVELTLAVASAINLMRVDWIIWHYRFGQCGRSKFISSHCHCLVFRKGNGQHTWNADAILEESDRSSKYNDSRTLTSATPCMRVPLDVWNIPRVVGNARERNGMENHPNQLPEKYLDRIIRAYTNVNDLILDPFGGTGTTASVAKKLNRRSVTIELSQQYCVDIVGRLEDIS